MPDEVKKAPNFDQKVALPVSAGGVEAPRVIEAGVGSASVEFTPPPEMSLPELSPAVEGYVKQTTTHQPLTSSQRKVGVTDSGYFATIHSVGDVSLTQTEQHLKSFGGRLDLGDFLRAAFLDNPARIIDAGVGFWKTLTRQKERQGLFNA